DQTAYHCSGCRTPRPAYSSYGGPYGGPCSRSSKSSARDSVSFREVTIDRIQRVLQIVQTLLFQLGQAPVDQVPKVFRLHLRALLLEESESLAAGRLGDPQTLEDFTGLGQVKIKAGLHEVVSLHIAFLQSGKIRGFDLLGDVDKLLAALHQHTEAVRRRG